jgi:hypothetical protein
MAVCWVALCGLGAKGVVLTWAAVIVVGIADAKTPH